VIAGADGGARYRPIGRRRQIATGVPAKSGSLHTAVAPGGQEIAGGGGVATAGAGAGGGNASATGAGAGGGAGIATAGAGAGGGAGGGAGIGDGSGVAAAGAGAPVTLGARAIGPVSGCTVIDKPGLAGGACAADSLGEHAPSHSGMTVMIAADRTTRLRQPSPRGFCLSAIARL
jgi:hypothetical protein